MSYKKNYQKEVSKTANFYICPNSIFDLDLSSTAQAVFCYLVSCGEDWHPSIGQILQKTKLAKNSVRKALKILGDKKMIKKVKEATKKEPAEYNILPPSQWCKILPNEDQNIALPVSNSDPLEDQNKATHKKIQEEHKKTSSSFLAESYEREEKEIVSKLLEKNGIFNVHLLIKEIVSAIGEDISLESILQLVAHYNNSPPKGVLNKIKAAYEEGIKQFNESFSNTVTLTESEDSIAEIDHAQRMAFNKIIGGSQGDLNV